MPKPPEGLVRAIAWICTVVTPFLFLLGAYLLSVALTSTHQDSYSDSLGIAIGGFSIILSLLMLGIGGVILKFKGMRIYKTILVVTVTIVILLFIAGELGLV